MQNHCSLFLRQVAEIAWRCCVKLTKNIIGCQGTRIIPYIITQFHSSIKLNQLRIHKNQGIVNMWNTVCLGGGCGSNEEVVNLYEMYVEGPPETT